MTEPRANAKAYQHGAMAAGVGNTRECPGNHRKAVAQWYAGYDSINKLAANPETNEPKDDDMSTDPRRIGG